MDGDDKSRTTAARRAGGYGRARRDATAAARDRGARRDARRGVDAGGVAGADGGGAVRRRGDVVDVDGDGGRGRAMDGARRGGRRAR